MCKRFNFNCYQVDGNLGICSLTGQWCKNNRGWMSWKNKYVSCNWYRRFSFWLRKKYLNMRVLIKYNFTIRNIKKG